MGQEGSAAKSDWYFHGSAGSSKSEIWQWWRERRPRYNRDLFFVGAGTWQLVMFAGSAAVKPGVDFEEPMMMVIGPLPDVLALAAWLWTVATGTKLD